MEWLFRRVGGRKITGFAACLLVGGLLIYFGRLDGVAAAFLCALYAAYVGGNAGSAIASAVKEFAIRKQPPEVEVSDGDGS